MKNCGNCDHQYVCGLMATTESGKCKYWSGWRDVKEELSTEAKAVNVVWVNHEPPIGYEEIKDKPFTATAVYAKGKWWWLSNVCVDILMEYGFSCGDEMDNAIEVIKWRELTEYEVEK